MDAILNWIVDNPIVTVVIAIIIIALIVYVFLNKKGVLYKAALHAVAVAESEWGSGTGKIKFAEVYTYIKKQFPLFTLFFTEAQLTKIIENALTELKEILAKRIAEEEQAEETVE